ncbi:MAG: 1-deoxy-D-xylulose-5-phosphate synthase [Alphaproteobacteria bacterium]|nr:MAG: 1-deoxy-D-xylulose-5-phosphate synthase [Alphaproteobacteria bacterium]TAF15936.1 MAG: 1-deoxy-D-xylulose-5-phosphate synthase [Alphaproteobacteria bacterium]TAF76750.1 MAG: 1-deoxy-D-xylulose-5-phosphate synthase [Alphaproteobacteria bacterium]
MTERPILDLVSFPHDLRRLGAEQLPALAQEVRDELIEVVSKTGGHLGAGLGVVELTLALHYVFDTPNDKIIWDVGHQAYPHKMITGRRKQLPTLRQEGGLSGFCKRDESPYDCFGAGHSSTSISAALGMAVARDVRGCTPFEVVAVIGDGAMSAGMAYEALNNAGAEKTRMFIILNDNEMSIAPAVGAMSKHLSKLTASSSYHQFRDFSKHLAEHLPSPIRHAAKRAERYARGVSVGGGSVFEELGMYYIGPLDGHDLPTLIDVLRSAKHNDWDRPVLLHVATQKGKGFSAAEANHEKYHGVNKFDVQSGEQMKPKATAPSYTSVFAEQLIKEARHDPAIVAITAAMPSGTGLNQFAKQFPERCFDVGIAEQHAVTFAAGLATEGIKPFVAIYSTFLQRGYDQLVHDVVIQNLPVRFMIDRAGLVGADGATHAGLFDLAYLCCLPNMVVMAPSDEAELVHMVHTAAAHNDSPIAVRFPRGEGMGVALPDVPEVLPLGKARIIHIAKNSSVALLNLGGRLRACMHAREMLQEQGQDVTIIDARFAKPLDTDMLDALVRDYDHVITLEEGSAGGFSAQVMLHVSRTQPHRAHTLHALILPDYFQSHGDPEKLYAHAGMDAYHIAQRVQQWQ